MRPTLRSGDRVTLAPPARPPVRGDLVALRTGNGLVIRRYVGRSPEGWIDTASDNVDTVEAPVRSRATSRRTETLRRSPRSKTTLSARDPCVARLDESESARTTAAAPPTNSPSRQCKNTLFKEALIAEGVPEIQDNALVWLAFCGSDAGSRIRP